MLWSLNSRYITVPSVSQEQRENHVYTAIFVMVPTLQTITNSSYYYEYRENIHHGVELTPA